MNKTIVRSVLLALMLVFSTSALSACLDEGDKVITRGVLKKEIVYGPPGFGEDPKDDEKMDYWFLYPNKPLGCFNTVDDDTSHYDKKIQIIMGDDQYNKYREFLGKDIKFNGKIMFANSPYHYTPVLIFHLSGVELVKGG
ncbi:DUF4431 domain-containing protein [Cronobacter malonaticus]|uniref:DUF4431 domain-containing protein n=1 Tax=Cronobacter malonaticus TaxID=413503 RepID=UPI002DB6A3A1|nr:DUF4431 domain-containing protein [Cronobacter malonaticus]MEB8476847.1 DUF4431 domain-containing protein [Cronobacter malonaticus]